MGIKSWLRNRYLRSRAKKAREGKMGETVKKAYWWLAGKKTYTGVAFAFVSAGLLAVGYYDAAEKVAYVASLLVSVGLLDKTWRATPPQK